MEAFYDFVRRIVKAFEDAGLDYMFTGALAASFYGVPRTTTDVDVVVGVATVRQRVKLVEALRMAELMVDERKIDNALKSGYRIATFKDSKTAYSVDVILSDKRLEKKVGTIVGVPTFYQTPEDLVSAKLRMIKTTVPRERALKDVDDVKAVLRFTEVDMELIRRRAREENTLEVLDKIIGEGFAHEVERDLR